MTPSYRPCVRGARRICSGACFSPRECRCSRREMSSGARSRGNNNAYCQDNQTSWVDWELAKKNGNLLSFVKSLIRWRKARPAFQRTAFFPTKSLHETERRELIWLHHLGHELRADEWDVQYMKCFGFRLWVTREENLFSRHGLMNRDTFMVLMNAHHEAIPFVFLEEDRAKRWTVVMDTSEVDENGWSWRIHSSDSYLLAGESLAILRARNEPPVAPEESAR